jgi:hypothetical protein
LRDLGDGDGKLTDIDDQSWAREDQLWKFDVVTTTIAATTIIPPETTTTTTTTTTTRHWVGTTETTTPTNIPPETTTTTIAAETIEYEMVFSGGEGDGNRFSTGNDGAFELFVLPNTSLLGCKLKCTETPECQRFYTWTTNQGAFRCRGLSDIGTAEGKPTTDDAES